MNYGLINTILHIYIIEEQAHCQTNGKKKNNHYKIPKEDTIIFIEINNGKRSNI